MLSQVFYALETFQVGVGLSGPYAKAEGELADERHRIADDVSFFTCHNCTFYAMTVQIYDKFSNLPSFFKKKCGRPIAIRT